MLLEWFQSMGHFMSPSVIVTVSVQECEYESQRGRVAWVELRTFSKMCLLFKFSYKLQCLSFASFSQESRAESSLQFIPKQRLMYDTGLWWVSQNSVVMLSTSSVFHRDKTELFRLSAFPFARSSLRPLAPQSSCWILNFPNHINAVKVLSKAQKRTNLGVTGAYIFRRRRELPAWRLLLQDQNSSRQTEERSLSPSICDISYASARQKKGNVFSKLLQTLAATGEVTFISSWGHP